MKKILLVFIFLLCTSVNVDAATLSVQSDQLAKTGDIVPVDIIVDTKDESINSVEATLLYPTELMTFSGYVSEKSTMSWWVVPPINKGFNGVHFSGIIPGGVDRKYDPQNPEDHSIVLVRLLFKIKNEGQATLVLKDVTLLKNDGRGTLLDATLTSTKVTIQKGTMTTSQNDDTTPRPFEIILLPKSQFGKTPRLAIWGMGNTEGAIKYYQAQINNGGWNTVLSPYAVPYRFFPYSLTIRAMGFNGNYLDQQIKIPVENSRVIIVIGILLFGGVVWCMYKLIRRNRHA